MKTFIIALKYCFLFYPIVFLHAQKNGKNFSVHPRALINAEEVEIMKKRIQSPQVRELYEDFQKDLHQRVYLLENGDSLTNYELAYLTTDMAAMYLFSDSVKWAGKAYQNSLKLINDPIFTDPFSRGLTRAMLVHQLAIVYDFCYNAWNKDQRKLINDALFEGMFSINANMGFSANYNIVSNWMGVRFGTVILAASVWDDSLEAKGQRSRALPLIWDATKRLQEHIQQNIYQNGWNGESLGYHNYGWSFIGPAIIALQNAHPNAEGLKLKNIAPHALNSIKAQAISSINIPRQHGIGLKIDLSDDNMNANPTKTLAYGFRIYPSEQLPAIKWMYDYMHKQGRFNNDRNALMYGILYYPLDLHSKNPSDMGWNQYHDPDQGIVVFRNKFQKQNDIVFAYSATNKRVKGHQGPDTNTLRLIGLGIPWIIGGGRTGETAGQSTFFPSIEETIPKNAKGTGKLISYKFEGSLSGITQGIGSCVGTQNHKRSVYVDLHSSEQAKAIIFISDSSDNGRRWRINTPEFNEIEILQDGYMVRAPNGSSMRVKVLSSDVPIDIKVEKVRYGGSTLRLNTGIGFQGKAYEYSKAIDIICKQNIDLVISLQDKGKSHPSLGWLKTHDYFISK